MPKRTTSPKKFLDLKEVLRLINIGRKAMRLKPLPQIPKGINEYNLCPLAIALNCSIWPEDGEEDRAPWCHCPPNIKATMQSKRAVRALAEAYDSTFYLNPHGVSDATLPEALARFYQEFERGAFPELMDRDLVKAEEIAKEYGLDAGRLVHLAWDDFIPWVSGFVDEVYLRKSEFNLTEVSRLMEEEAVA
jgi:hypothetical protein